jgi:hypothetical protein
MGNKPLQTNNPLQQLTQRLSCLRRKVKEEFAKKVCEEKEFGLFRLILGFLIPLFAVRNRFFDRGLMGGVKKLLDFFRTHRYAEKRAPAEQKSKQDSPENASHWHDVLQVADKATHAQKRIRTVRAYSVAV